jgi:hypothetical protein
MVKTRVKRIRLIIAIVIVAQKNLAFLWAGFFVFCLGEILTLRELARFA